MDGYFIPSSLGHRTDFFCTGVEMTFQNYIDIQESVDKPRA
jgi:hypothetical protein